MAEQVGSLVTTHFAQTLQSQPAVAHNGGRLRSVTDYMVAVDAAENDTVHMAKLPSNAVIHHTSKIWFDDFGTSVTLDIGTFNVNGSTADDDNSINDGVDVATAAGSADLLSGFTKHGKYLWELAGASADPGGLIDIKATIKDANPGSAGMAWEIVYTVD